MTDTYDLTVSCTWCGTELAIEEDHRRQWCVEPCAYCIDAAKKDGYNDGENEGYDRGHADGYKAAERYFKDFKTNG